MLALLPLAAAQLGDPRVQRVLVKSLFLTLLLFIAAVSLVGWLATGSNPCGWGPLGGDCTIRVGAGMVAAFVFGLLSLWLLFPAVAIGILGLYADEVVAAVEERHYPEAARRARPPSAARSVATGLRSAGRLTLWNLLALPFYALLLVTGVGPLLLFFTVNALALGRDLGEMVAARHLQGSEVGRWLEATRGRRALLGLLTAVLFSVPFANLLAPVLGAAMATHLFHRERPS